MNKLEIKLKLKKDADLSLYGFVWKIYEPSTGTCWTNGYITYYSKTEQIVYDKMSQEVLDSLLALVSAGVFYFAKK